VPKLDRLPSSTAALTRAARAMTELELEDFAALVATPAVEVDAWEQGTRAPPAIGVRLLTLILTTPEVCLDLLDTPGAADSGRCTA
jgi:DNA-binding transcriptional regulator YiaG